MRVDVSKLLAYLKDGDVPIEARMSTFIKELGYIGQGIRGDLAWDLLNEDGGRECGFSDQALRIAEALAPERGGLPVE